MKLEVGMYCYDKCNRKAGIGKIISFQKNNNVNIRYKNDIDLVSIGNVVASHNIINLLEPMDLLYLDISPDNCGGIVVPRIMETLNELNYVKDLIKDGTYILKGVVTREQLESMKYEINN